jgi:hypothetical protein
LNSLSGAALVLLGFALAVLWDQYKERRATRRRDASLLLAAKAEVESIAATAQNDLNLVRSELAQLTTIGGGGSGLLNPLDPLEGGFWDIVKLNPPRVLLRDEQTIAQIRDVARRTDQVNEMIRTREAYKTSNAALASSLGLAQSAFSGWVQGYDQLIERWLTELLDALQSLEAALEKAGESRSWTARIVEEARRPPRVKTVWRTPQDEDATIIFAKRVWDEIRRPARRRW